MVSLIASAEAIDLAVASGKLRMWAKVAAFESGRFIRLERLDTDGKELTVRARDIRAAVRRVIRLEFDPDRLGLNRDEIAAIIVAANGKPMSAMSVDQLVQIAATVRARYGSGEPV